MKWLGKILDTAFRNLYSVCSGILLFTIAVLLITMSAQHIGDFISVKVLDKKSTEIIFIVDSNSNKSDIKDIYNLMDAIKNDNNLQKYHLKITKISENDNFLKKNTAILFTTNKNIIQNLATERKLMILDKSIFADRTHKYVQLSKYSEFALAETTSNHLKIYIGVVSSASNTEKTKLIRTLKAISDCILQKIDLQPDA